MYRTKFDSPSTRESQIKAPNTLLRIIYKSNGPRIYFVKEFGKTNCLRHDDILNFKINFRKFFLLFSNILLSNFCRHLLICFSAWFCAILVKNGFDLIVTTQALTIET